MYSEVIVKWLVTFLTCSTVYIMFLHFRIRMLKDDHKNKIKTMEKIQDEVNESAQIVTDYYTEMYKMYERKYMECMEYIENEDVKNNEKLKKITKTVIKNTLEGIEKK